MISVLMPVYNVEKYIEKTLQSLKAQTYSDFEVIMVDDGSTDKSGEICDKWCESDSRFKVIHTENRGVSAARNTALDNVSGEYIFFMDSDDIILPETFEELMSLREETDADFSLGNTYYTDREGNPLEKLNSQSPIKNTVLTNIEYLEQLCKPSANFYCTLWNKIYKSELFDSIRFPLNKIHEDEAIIHQVVYRCKKIATTDKRYYNYIKHPVSITGASFNPKKLDREDAFLGRIEFLRANGLSELADKTALVAIDSAIVSMTKLIDNSYYYGKAREKVLSVIRDCYPQAKRVKNITKAQKKILTVAWVILTFGDFYEKYLMLRSKMKSMGTANAVIDEVYNFIMKCISHLPTKDRIIFESHPELTCNTYPVFKYLLDKGINEKYELCWLCDDKNKYNDSEYSKIKNVKFINNSKNSKSIGDKLKYMHYVSTAKALVYSNQLLGQWKNDRLSLWLEHGMPLKSSNGTYCIKNNCTNAVCEAEYFADYFSNESRVEKDKLLYFGFPRNDELFSENDAAEKFDFGSYDKVVFWLPTFRQRNEKSKIKNVTGYEMKAHGTGIPAIETVEEMKRVNEYLKDKNILLVLKPHPVQDLSGAVNDGLDNFLIINDDLLQKKGVRLYQLLGKTDAMITDYSSVYYDYLLCNKPIGLTIGDIDEYTAKRGFVYKNPRDILKGSTIKTTDDLIAFLSDISKGVDAFYEDRNRVRNMIFKEPQGNAAKKVGDYIISFIGK